MSHVRHERISKRMHHIGRRVVVAGLLVALILGFVAAIHYVASPYVAMRNYAIGAGVTVTGSKTPRNIKAVTSNIKPPESADFQRLGQTIQVTPGGALPAPLTLEFKLAQRATSGEHIELETSESPSGPWSLVPGTVSSDGWSVSVQTTHLSLWQTVLFNITQTVLDIESKMANDATGNLFAPLPHLTCDNSTQAQQGYTVSASSSTNTLAWCMGVDNGQRILKIVNRMRYPLYVQYPGLTLISTPGWSDSLMAQFDRFEYQGKAPATFLAPLEEADFNVSLATGSAAYINTVFDINAQMLSMLVIGVTTAAAFLTANGAGEGAETAELAGEASTGPTSASASQRTFDVISKLLNYAPCANAVTKQSFTAFLSECLSAAALSDGVLSFAHAQLVSIIMTFSGLIAFVIGTINGLVDSVMQNDRYIIYLAVPKSPHGSGTSSPTPPPPPPAPPQPPAPAPTQVDNSQWVANSPYVTVSPGQSLNVSFTYTNDGTTTWSDGGGYALVCDTYYHGGGNASCMGGSSVDLGGQVVGPGQQHTFQFTLTAPSAPGVYTTWWDMAHKGSIFGNNNSYIQVTVQAPPSSPQWNAWYTVHRPACDDSSAWSDVNHAATRDCSSGSGLVLSQYSNTSWAEVDLDTPNGSPYYTQNPMREEVQADFLNPGDTSVWATLVAETPQGATCGGFLFAVNSQGYWKLQQTSGSCGISTVQSGQIGINPSGFSLQVTVLNNQLSAAINGQTVVSGIGNSLNPSPGAEGLMEESPKATSSAILFSSFEIDHWS